MDEVEERAERPWWRPRRTDHEWCEEIRKEYDAEGMTDEDIREEYANGLDYEVTWDNLRDAYEEYKRLAEEYLRLDGSEGLTEFARARERGVTCDLCGRPMTAIVGGGWKNDRIVCTSWKCGAEIEYPTTTPLEEQGDESTGCMRVQRHRA